MQFSLRGSLILTAITASFTTAAHQPRYKEVLRIANSAIGNEPFVLSSITAVAASTNGSMFVLDKKEHDVKVFDATGRFVRTIGRAGAGPGELTGPVFRMQIDRNRLVITDYGLRRDVSFRLDGTHLQTANHSSTGSAGVATTYQLRGNSLLRVTSPFIERDKIEVHWRVSVIGRGAERPLGAIRSDMVEVMIGESPNATYSFESLGTGHGGAYAVAGDSLVALVDGMLGQATMYRAGANGFVQTAKVTFATASAPVTIRHIDPTRRKLEDRWRRLRPGARVSLSNPPKTVSVASAALFDNRGRLWVGAPCTSAGCTWKVLSETGVQSTYVLPAGFTLTSVMNERLYGHAINADELPEVRVYALER